MKKNHLMFLELLETELGRTIVPAIENAGARSMAGLALQELKRIVVDAVAVPTLRADAIQAYRDLIPEMRMHIDRSIVTRFESALSAATDDWEVLELTLKEITDALMTHEDKESSTLAGHLIAIDSRVRDGKEAACLERSKRQMPAADEAVVNGLDAALQPKLLDFLKQQFPREKSLRIAAVRPLPGGFSKQTLFIDLAGNFELPGMLVMRRDPPWETQGTSVSMEFPVLEKMFAAGVKVPKPYAVDASGDVLGKPFILVASAPGRVMGDFLVVAERNRKAMLSIARESARLHAVSTEGLEHLLHGGATSPRERVQGEIDKHVEMLNAVVNHNDYALNAALDWLRRNIALADGPRAIIHRDIGVHNLLIEGDEVTAILDWETVVIGTPAEDVAYPYYQMTQVMDWGEYVAAYENEAGVKLDHLQLDFYNLWASVRIVIGIYRMVDPVYSGDRKSLLHFYIGDYFAQTLMRRVSSKLAEILLKQR